MVIKILRVTPKKESESLSDLKTRFTRITLLSMTKVIQRGEFKTLLPQLTSYVDTYLDFPFQLIGTGPIGYVSCQ